jgi:AraC-like DNA-binding protein
MHWQVDGDVARLSYQIDDPRVKDRRQDAEFTVMTIHNFFRTLLGEVWRLDRVEFAHAAKSSQRRHDQLLDTTVEFRKPCNALYLQKSLLDLELPAHDPLLLRHLEDYFRQRQYDRDRHHRLTRRVAQLVELALEHGAEPRLEDVADAVGMSVRTLHRRLTAEGSRFRNIVLDCRMTAAKALLRETDISLTVLGVQMGYSDATAFSRAFRKKVGMSPLAWRTQCRVGRPA